MGNIGDGDFILFFMEDDVEIFQFGNALSKAFFNKNEVIFNLMP